MNAPKRGTRFVHSRWLDPSDMKPLRCVVTAVRGGTVYYRPDYGLHDDGTPWLGSVAYFPIEDFGRVAQEVLA